MPANLKHSTKAQTPVVMMLSEEANGWNESPGVYPDEMTQGWKHTTKAVHDKGGVIFLQLWHMGLSNYGKCIEVGFA